MRIALLEIVVQLQCLRCHEREEVAVDRRADVGGAVYPELGIAQACPGTGPGPPHARDVRGVEQQPVAPLVAGPGPERAADGRVGGRELAGEVQLADLVAESRVHGGLAQDPGSVEFGAPQQRLLELDVITRRPVQPVAAGPVLGRLIQDLADPASPIPPRRSRLADPPPPAPPPPPPRAPPPPPIPPRRPRPAAPASPIPPRRSRLADPASP